MSLSDGVAVLLDERAIRRVLLQYCRGIDRFDLERVRDCYWPEATDRHGPFSGSRDEFISWVGPLLRRQTMTMHHLGNILIDFPADRGRPTGAAGSADAPADIAPADVAVVETYGVAYHSGEPAGDLRWNYAAGFRYIDRFERRAGQWRIADRTTAIEWTRAWDADRERIKVFGEHLPDRDGADPVFPALRALEQPAAATPIAATPIATAAPTGPGRA